MYTGFARYPITPPLGIELAGYQQREGTADRVHDDLNARAVVIGEEGSAVLLIAVDVCALPVDIITRARSRIRSSIGIPEDRVMVAAVHTHSGPALQDSENAYTELLPDLIASAGELAWRNRKDTALRYSRGTAEGMCVNRRDFGGSVDEEIDVITAHHVGGIEGVLFSVPLHGVVMGHTNLTISADYIHFARAGIESRTGCRVAVFFAGASGQMNPLTGSVKRLLDEHGESWYTADPLTGIYDRSTGTFEEAREIGAVAGSAVVSSLETAVPVEHAEVHAKRWQIDIGAEKELCIELQVFSVDDVVFIALPGEHFIETGIALRTAVRAAGKRPFIVTHAGHLAYIPPKEEFARGGYEVAYSKQQGISEDAQERILASIQAEIETGYRA